MKLCEERSEGYTCTLPAGHAGKHEASGGKGVVHRSWDKPSLEAITSTYERMKAKHIAAMSLLPTDPAERKRVPIWSGVLQYFPDAIVEIAKVSYAGNEQHNPGEPLHWAREKSTDQEDTIVRHLMESGKRDTDGQLHTAKAAWRILAKLQLELERGKNANQVPKQASNVTNSING